MYHVSGVSIHEDCQFKSFESNSCEVRYSTCAKIKRRGKRLSSSFHLSGYEFVQGFTMLEAEPALLSCQDGQFVGGKAVAVANSFAVIMCNHEFLCRAGSVLKLWPRAFRICSSKVVFFCHSKNGDWQVTLLHLQKQSVQLLAAFCDWKSCLVDLEASNLSGKHVKTFPDNKLRERNLTAYIPGSSFDPMENNCS